MCQMPPSTHEHDLTWKPGLYRGASHDEVIRVFPNPYYCCSYKDGDLDTKAGMRTGRKERSRQGDVSTRQDTKDCQ